MSACSRPPLPAGPFLVAGLRRAGHAAVDALLRTRPGPVSAWDAACTPALRGIARRLRARGVDVTLGGDGVGALRAAGPGTTVVKSPGISMDATMLRAARSRDLAIIDELELGWRLCPAPVVGVTGTNGKSTTARLCRAVLERATGPTELAGNSEHGVPLSAARGGGWVVCEVSSFQLEASPTMRPEVAVLTNLTPEHLDRHGDMGAYGAAKRRMFLAGDATAGTSVVNLDDPFGRELDAELRAAGGRVCSYGFDPRADVCIESARWDLRTATLRVRGPRGAATGRTRTPGLHNASNTAAALAVAEAVDVPLDDALATLAEVTPPPGRWQPIDEGQPFDVIVDYAHTPDGIQRALEAVRAVVDTRDGARLLTVFGPVGLRDDAKDRDNGRIAATLSDRLFVTTGSAPCDGRVRRMQLVKHAAPDPGGVEVVLDRDTAIAGAIGDARPNDVVALLGLGDLRGQALDAHSRQAHHDGDAARRALRGARAWS